MSQVSGRLSRFREAPLFLRVAKQLNSLPKIMQKVWSGGFALSLLGLLFSLAAATGAQHDVPSALAGGVQRQRGADVCTALQRPGGSSEFDLLTSILQERLMTLVAGKTAI